MNALLPSAAWPRLIPFALFMCVLAIRGAIDDEVPGWRGWTLNEMLYAVQAAAAAAALLLYWPQYSELRDHRSRGSHWVASLAVGALVFVLWINLDAGWMRVGEPVTRFVPVDEAGSIDWMQVLLRAAGAVVVVPLMEELFWRSFVMRSIDARDFDGRPPAAATTLAIVASSGVFALGHDMWLAGILAGLAYALLYVRTGNLWCAVLAHALTNLLLAAWVVRTGRWEFW